MIQPCRTQHHKTLKIGTNPSKGTVARRCRVSGNTVVNWVNGLTRPSDDIYMDVLSEISGISKNDLFRYDN